MNWQRTLTRPIVHTTPKPVVLRTLSGARTFLLSLDPAVVCRVHWQEALRLMLYAAGGGNVEAATRQIEVAMLRDRMLDYDTAGVEKQAECDRPTH